MTVSQARQRFDQGKIRLADAVMIEALTVRDLDHVSGPQLAQKGIGLDRKVLADLAMNEPESFSRLIAAVK